MMPNFQCIHISKGLHDSKYFHKLTMNADPFPLTQALAQSAYKASNSRTSFDVSFNASDKNKRNDARVIRLFVRVFSLFSFSP